MKRTLLNLILICMSVAMIACGGSSYSGEKPTGARPRLEGTDNATVAVEETEETKMPETTEEILKPAEKIPNPLADIDIIYAGEFGCEDNETAVVLNNFVNSIPGLDRNRVMGVTAADFDNNHTPEAFIFVGQQDEICYTGELFYADENYVESLGEYDLYSFDGYANFDGKKIAYFGQYFATAELSHVYEVDDGKPVESNISRIGSVSVDKGVISIIVSDYDFMWDKANKIMMGHSWKPYYFKYNLKMDDFIEECGIFVRLEEADKICGFDIIEQLADKGYAFGNVFMRDNDILIINLVTNSESEAYYSYVSYDCINNKFINPYEEVYDISSAITEGCYQYSVFYEIDVLSGTPDYEENVTIEVEASEDVFAISENETTVVCKCNGYKRAFKAKDFPGRAGLYDIRVVDGVIVSYEAR